MAKFKERLILGMCSAALLGLAACDNPQGANEAASLQDSKSSVTEPKQASVVPPRPDPQRPITYPEYPSASQRLGEEGQVVLLVTVSPDGRVNDAKIDQSSGHPRLDRAALEEAKESWRMMPGTVDGKPTPMSYKVAVSYQLEDE